MTKLDLEPRSLTLPSALVVNAQPVRRLIVFMPPFDVDVATSAGRIWELANDMDATVLFLGVYNDPAQELSLRRTLVTISAMVNDDRVSTEAEVIFGNDWVEIMRSHRQPDDLVICFAEQRVGLLRKPLSQVLASDTRVPLYIFSGLYSHKDLRSIWPAQAVAWAGSIAIIFAFLLFQLKVDLPAKNSLTLLWFLLSVGVEIWVIGVWNRLFG